MSMFKENWIKIDKEQSGGKTGTTGQQRLKKRKGITYNVIKELKALVEVLQHETRTTC